MKKLALSIAFVATLTSGTAYTGYSEDSKTLITPLVADSSCNRSGTVNTDKDSLNIREKPSQNAKVVAKAPKNAKVCILSVHDDNWYKIRYKSVVGYAASAYIKG